MAELMEARRISYHLEHAGPPGGRGRFGWAIRLAVACCLFVAVAVVAGLLVLASPTLTRSLSSVIFKPQAGAVQWNGRDRITIAMLGLTQRTSEPARTDTLLLMNVDPSRHVIHMLSVPRDRGLVFPVTGTESLRFRTR